jgi:hypothetical protein
LLTHVRFAPAGGTGEVAQRADYDDRLFAMRRPLRAYIGSGDAVNVGAIASSYSTEL